MKYLMTLVFFLVIAAGSIQTSNGQQSSAEAVLVWKTDAVFNVPESVFYDEGLSAVYVSNINGNPLERDGNGFISRLSTGGDMEELRWVSNLNAPKGMGKTGEMLYVTDIDELIAIHIPGKRIVNRYPVDGAVFLNDITTDPQGNVYFSDYHTDKIHRFDGERVELFLDAGILDAPNGLYHKNNYLYIGCNGYIVKVNLKDGDHKKVVKDVGPIDGLNVDCENNFIISDWSGKVQYVSPPGDITVLFDTSDEKINAADIFYVPSKKMLYVPTFSDNRVMAYEIRFE